MITRVTVCIFSILCYTCTIPHGRLEWTLCSRLSSAISSVYIRIKFCLTTAAYLDVLQLSVLPRHLINSRYATDQNFLRPSQVDHPKPRTCDGNKHNSMQSVLTEGEHHVKCLWCYSEFYIHSGQDEKYA